MAEIIRDEADELEAMGATYLQLDAPHYTMVLDPRYQDFYASRGWPTERWMSVACAPGVVAAVDRHREPVAVGVGEPGERGGELTDSFLGSCGPVLGGCQGAAEAVLVVVVRSFKAGEPGDVGVDAGLLEHQRIAGGDCLDLSEGQGLVGDVVDIAVRKIAAGHLGNERGLPLERLPSPNFGTL